ERRASRARHSTRSGGACGPASACRAAARSGSISRGIQWRMTWDRGKAGRVGGGTRVELAAGMDETHQPTVEMSLEALSQALGKASDDLSSVRNALEAARADIATRNTSLTRDVVKHADRVIRSLKETDEGLRDVLEDLAERG